MKTNKPTNPSTQHRLTSKAVPVNFHATSTTIIHHGDTMLSRSVLENIYRWLHDDLDRAIVAGRVADARRLLERMFELQRLITDFDNENQS